MVNSQNINLVYEVKDCESGRSIVTWMEEGRLELRTSLEVKPWRNSAAAYAGATGRQKIMLNGRTEYSDVGAIVVGC